MYKSIGAKTGLAVFFIGGFGISGIGNKLNEMKKDIAVIGGNPTYHQQNMLKKLQNSLNQAETIVFIFLAVSITTIATARYLIF